MNFLAHFHLAGGSEPILAGSFLADFIKASPLDRYPPDVRRGILLHREIDTFTGSHPQVGISRRRLWHQHRHYSAVIVDIFYDHFLAKNWQEYSSLSLPSFARLAYAALQTYEDLLPPRARQTFLRMIADNWLVHYGQLAGVDRAMQGMARRASFPTAMASAIADLRRDYSGFESDFKKFFPAVTSHARTLLR